MAVEDDGGRQRGVQMRYVGVGRLGSTGSGALGAAAGAALFGALLVGLLVLADLPSVVPLGYAVLSAVAFGMYGADKAAAQQGRRRTPESTLHLIGLAGGWPGALIARQLFRHKTVKQPFSTIFWGTAAINCGALACFWMVPTLSSLLAA